jgi:hypothetical protein
LVYRNIATPIKVIAAIITMAYRDIGCSSGEGLGDAVGCGVGDGVGVDRGVGVGVGVGSGVGEGVGVGVGVGSGVMVYVSITVSLSAMPLLNALALIVVVELTEMGPEYTVEEDVGSEPLLV